MYKFLTTTIANCYVFIITFPNYIITFLEDQTTNGH